MKRHHPIPFLFVLASLALPAPAPAGPTADGHWKVSRGDTLFGIARRLAPGDRDRQRGLRHWILEHNRAVFGGDPDHLPLGALLQLPRDIHAAGTGTATPAPTAAAPVTAPARHARTTETPLQEPVTIAPPVATNTPSTPSWTTTTDSDTGATEETTQPPPIGHIVIAAGDTEVISAMGQPRATQEIREGDTVTTGPQSSLQLRFSDGALMTLRPNSRLRVTRYHFDRAHPEADATTLELIKGGLRTLTGVIGKRNRDRYRVQTSVATIGIRGTHYGLRLCGPNDCPGHEPGLYGAVADGAIVVRNRQGEFRFGNDEYFHLKAADARPRGLIRPPGVIFDADRGLRRARLQRPPGAAGERRQQARLIRRIARRGHPEALAIARLLPLARPGVIRADQSQANNLSMQRAPQGAVAVVAFNDLRFGVGSDGAAVRDNGTPDHVILLGKLGPVANVPVIIRETDPVSGNVYSFAAGQARLLDTGGDPMGVNWGRWNGPFVVAENGNPAPHAGNFHFAYSPNIATLQQLSQLKGINAKTPVIYSPRGGTPATDHQGNVGSIATASLTVDFFNQNVVGFNVTASVGPNTFDGNLIQPIPIPQAVVNGIPLASNNPNNACSAGCSGHASLAFVNDYANNKPAAGAITSYSISTNNGTAGVSGVVFLTRP